MIDYERNWKIVKEACRMAGRKSTVEYMEFLEALDKKKPGRPKGSKKKSSEDSESEEEKETHPPPFTPKLSHTGRLPDRRRNTRLPVPYV